MVGFCSKLRTCSVIRRATEASDDQYLLANHHYSALFLFYICCYIYESHCLIFVRLIVFSEFGILIECIKYVF
jgi:hypothetical protein